MARQNIFTLKSPPGTPVSTYFDTGESRVVSRFPGNEFIASSADTWYPLMSIRLNPFATNINLIPLDLSISPVSFVFFSWAILGNDPDQSIVNGADNANWASFPNSKIQYDLSRNNTNSLIYLQGSARSGGAGSGLSIANRNLEIEWSLGKNEQGNPYEIIVAVNCVTPNQQFIGAMNFTEVCD